MHMSMPGDPPPSMAPGEPEPDPFGYLRFMIQQARAAMDTGLYFPALAFALTIPDICGAASSQNGRATGERYKKWLKKYVPREVDDADLLYKYRCSLLHQGRRTQGLTRLAFVEPNPHQSIHGATFVNMPFLFGVVHKYIDIRTFLEEVAAGVEAWIAAEGRSPTVLANMDAHLKRYPNGLQSVHGRAVIA